MSVFVRLASIILLYSALACEAAESAGGERIGSRRASQREIDPAGIERLERAELFGDDQR